MLEIINGDCLIELPKVLEKFKDREIIIVTDPPFNIGYHYRTYNDRMKEEDYFNFLSEVLKGLTFVIIHYPEQIYKIALRLGKVPERVVSWVYNSNTARQHRDIAFFGINPDFKKVTQPYKNPKDKRILKRIAEGKLGCKLYDWWNVNQVKNVSKEKVDHPCQMPIEVMKNVIGILPEEAIIVDPFNGSGTTAVVCKLLGRDYIGIEIDSYYCDLTNKRLEEIERG